MKLWKILGIELYEVGDIIITSSSNNPSSRFKGTWELIAQGMTIVGVKASDTDFNVVNKTGRSKTHTLIDAEVPDTKIYGSISGTGGKEVYRSYTGGGVSNSFGGVIGKVLGSNQPHNNLQPYITKYIWERVS